MMNKSLLLKCKM